MEAGVRKLLLIIFVITMFAPVSSFAFEPTGVKILSKVTKHAILSGYYIEEVQEVPSSASFIVNGKKLDLVAEAEDIEKWLQGKKGKKFRITYGKVHGWLGDGESDYEVLMDAKQLK